MNLHDNILQSLSAAIYSTDAVGKITFYNEEAAELWGVRPDLGQSEFPMSWPLFWPDGSLLPYEECAMAIALSEQRSIRGQEVLATRPTRHNVELPLAMRGPSIEDRPLAAPIQPFGYVYSTINVCAGHQLRPKKVSDAHLKLCPVLPKNSAGGGYETGTRAPSSNG